MVIGPPTVTQTSETKPATTTTTAAGPIWAAASVELARPQEEAGQVVLWVNMKGSYLQCRKSRRRAMGERVLVKMAESGRR